MPGQHVEHSSRTPFGPANHVGHCLRAGLQRLRPPPATLLKARPKSWLPFPDNTQQATHNKEYRDNPLSVLMRWDDAGTPEMLLTGHHETVRAAEHRRGPVVYP